MRILPRKAPSTLLATGVITALLVVTTAPAQAVGAPDQFQTAASNRCLAVTLNFGTAQTFTAGRDGALDQIELLLLREGQPTGTLTVEVRTVDGTGVPTAVVLATSDSIPVSSVPTTDTDPPTPSFVPFVFPQPATVVSGTQYAIVLSASNPTPAGGNGPPNAIFHCGASPDPYPFGMAFNASGNPLSSFSPIADFDFGFKTYVTAPPPDNDADRVPNADDNCAAVENPAQTDTDGDGLGDACDPAPGTPGTPGTPGAPGAPGSPGTTNDNDADGVPNASDNCAAVENPGQRDSDGDGLGNACDLTPGTGSAVSRARCDGVRATIVGSRRGDVIVGTPRSDVIAGRGGNDRIRGLGGRDLICGGRGNDLLKGGPGRDRLLGGPGDDRRIQ